MSEHYTYLHVPGYYTRVVSPFQFIVRRARAAGGRGQQRGFIKLWAVGEVTWVSVRICTVRRYSNRQEQN